MASSLQLEKDGEKMFAIYIKEYGYYEGKIYQNDNEFYPEAEIHSISEFTKIYKTQYLAEKAAKAIVKKCTYIQDFQVKIIQINKGVK